MGKICSLIICSFFLNGFIFASESVTVAYFSMEKKEVFESKIKPFFIARTQSCAKCSIVDFTPYKENGHPDPTSFKNKFEQLPSDIQIIFLDWNEQSSPSNDFFVELVSKKIQEGKLVIAVTGVASSSEKVLALKNTLFGRVKDIIILGELEPRDVLRPRSHFGPEILTAVRPPKELMGQGYGPLIFVTRLVNVWGRRSGSDWLTYLKQKKEKSRHLWPELDELLSSAH